MRGKRRETAKHLGKSLVASVLADPLSGLMGKRAFSQGRRSLILGPIRAFGRSYFPEAGWQGPPVQVWQGPEKQGTSVDLSTLSKPKPTNPLPTITELADAARDAPETSPAGRSPDEMLEKTMIRSPESRQNTARPKQSLRAYSDTW